jgi:molybdate transport system permease protein
MSELDVNALLLTLKLALITSSLLVCICMPLAWYLANANHKIKPFLEAIFALPLVLPPTVLGFYLLIAFAPDSWLGTTWFEVTGKRLAFSFEALVLGSMIYSLPFVIQPMHLSFSNISKSLLNHAAILGAKPIDRFISIILPMSKSGIITGFALGFAHTLGEFGVVLMIGGNIPGETQLISLALYNQVESLNYAQAHVIASWLLILSFSLLVLTFMVNGSKTMGMWGMRQSKS